MKLTKKRLKEIIIEELQKFNEAIVRIAPMKDANFGGGMVQLLGKKGKVGLDKRSVHKLAKIVRSQSKGSKMGWSFTMESKLDEGSTTLPNGVKVKIDFKGLTLQSKGNPVFLDRREMMTFFKATARYLK